MTYDPTRISYERLLAQFWSLHDPEDRPWSVQYRTAVMPLDDAQLAVARASVAELGRRGVRVRTPIERIAHFWPAEPFHQKFYLRRNRALWREAQALYSREDELLASTLATRLNAFQGRGLSRDALGERLAALDLDAPTLERLLEATR